MVTESERGRRPHTGNRRPHRRTRPHAGPVPRVIRRRSRPAGRGAVLASSARPRSASRSVRPFVPGGIMAHARRAALAAAATLAVACGEAPSPRDAAVARAALTTLQAAEHPVSTTPDVEATPALGRDARGPFVVYASRPVLPGGGWGPGTVWYQRLRDGAPDGAPVRVSAGGTDDQLDDASGRYVVYTAWDSPSALSGRIVVHDVADGTTSAIASAGVMQEARIAGTKVAWLQGYPGEASLMLHDL